MKNDCKKGFIILSKAWYGEVNLRDTQYVDELTFGLYDEDYATTGEASIRWYKLGEDISPRVEVFSDGWFIFTEFKDFFELLSKYNNKDLTPVQVENILKECGFKDMTPVKAS